MTESTIAQDIWAAGAWHSGAPYSPGVRVGEWLFVSGAVPVDPDGGASVGATIQEQTDRVLHNIRLVVEAAGGSLRDVVKTTVYLTDQNDAAGMNEAYRTFFSAPHPARATVMVGPLARPEFLVEIEAVARIAG